jgi:hypothetical protein
MANIKDLISFPTLSVADITDAGQAASRDVGITLGKVIEVVDIGGNPGLPALDGSLITGLGGGLAGCRIEQSSSLSPVGDGVEYVIPFDTDLLDSNNYHNTGADTTKVTVPAGQDGYYVIGGAVQWSASASGSREAHIRVDGGAVKYGYVRTDQSLNTDAGVNIVTILHLNVGQYIELVTKQTSGGNLTIGNVSKPELWAFKLDFANPLINGIDGLTDVDTTTIASAANQLLRFNGTDWVNDLSITTSAETNNQLLRYTGTTWANDISIGTGPNDIVQLNGSGQLPAVDGSLLTGINAGADPLVIKEYDYTATASQTVFTGADDNANTLAYNGDNIIVSYNGAILASSDYTANDNASVVLTVGATAGHIVKVQVLTGNFRYNFRSESSNVTVMSSDYVFALSGTAAFTVTLPTAVAVGDVVVVQDVDGNAATNNTTVVSDGTDKLLGDASNSYLIDTNDAKVEFRWSGTTRGWIVAESS